VFFMFASGKVGYLLHDQLHLRRFHGDSCLHVFVLHVCIRQGCPCYLFHGICFRLVEIIPTVSLAIELASHYNSLIYQKKISTYLCTCLLCELPKNKCVGPFEFLLKCLNLQKQHNVYSCVCLLFNVWTFILLSAQINGSTTWVFAASLCFLCQFDALFLLHMLMWFWKWAWQSSMRS